MGSQVTPALLTAEKFLERYADQRCELVRGEVVAMPSAGAEHGEAGAQIVSALVVWNNVHRRGRVAGPDAGFTLARDPDTVRVPDAAFVRAERVAGHPRTEFYPLAPDLAVEVVSPSDRRRQVTAKVAAWFAAGTQIVWVVWPSRPSVWLCRPNRDPVVLSIDDVITCDDLLPGFALPVRIVLEPVA